MTATMLKHMNILAKRDPTNAIDYTSFTRCRH